MREYFKGSIVVYPGRKVLIPSSFVCLFWLSDDGLKVVKTAGEVEFNNSDIVTRKTIDPKGTHDKYVKDSFNYNRGKISLIGGKVDLSVGKNLSDKAISVVKDYFGISNFDVNVYRTGSYDR